MPIRTAEELREQSDTYESVARLIERTTGQVPPIEPFPAIITGLAEVLRAGETPPTDSDLQNCFHPTGGTIDPISGVYFYPNEKLPTGVVFRRYRWRAVFNNLDSEGCGLRDNGSPNLVPWRQAWYALNTAELDHDRQLDYPAVNVGTSVLMAFGRIGNRINDTPRWGFFFHFKPDPKGILLCPNQSGGVQGCCALVDPNTQQTQYFCSSQIDCLSLGGFYLGDNVGCPGGGSC